MVKLIALLRRDGPDEGWERWLAAAIAGGVQGLRRLVLNVVAPVDVRHGFNRETIRTIAACLPYER